MEKERDELWDLLLEDEIVEHRDFVANLSKPDADRMLGAMLDFIKS